MRFSLRTLQIAVLVFVLTLGLPALLPPSLMLGLVWLVHALVTIAFLTRLVYTRGQSQAFALGATAMGLMWLWPNVSDRNMVLPYVSGFSGGYLWYRTFPILIGLWRVLLMFGAGYFARWIYDQIPKDAQP